MATSIYAAKVEDKLDPKARNPFVIPLRPALEAGEEISTWSIVVSPEAAALGLTILTAADGKADPALIEANCAVELWIGIDPEFQDDPAFEGPGKGLSFEVFYSTSSSPPRDDNRTLMLVVANL